MVQMLTSQFSQVRSWPVVRRMARWRGDLSFYWVTWEKDNLVFISLLAIVGVLLGCLVYFAYASHIRMAAERQRHADLICLARNIYFEARGEPLAGQRAVAEVTLNRVVSRHFPSTVCEVVYEKRWDRRRNRYVGAFSWTELESTSKPKGATWQRAVMAAQAVYDDEQAPVVQGALFYHANNIEPGWAKTKKQVAKIGRHIFYE